MSTQRQPRPLGRRVSPAQTTGRIKYVIDTFYGSLMTISCAFEGQRVDKQKKKWSQRQPPRCRGASAAVGAIGLDADAAEADTTGQAKKKVSLPKTDPPHASTPAPP